jgi:NADPH:quinone reductase-like Zn-dependent oxidoreductase
VGTKALSLVHVPEPNLGPLDVLVRVRAVSLNHRDLLNAEGTFGDPPRWGLVPCSDCAGDVEAVGTDVTRFVTGDRVAATFFQDWAGGPFTPRAAQSGLGGSLDGVLTQYLCLPEAGFVRVPSGLDYAEAATLPCAALTAWNALFGRRCLRPGQTVLVLGSGGVSVFALQMASAVGARVVATTGTPTKAARLQELGAEAVIDHKRRLDWGRAVLEATAGHGGDHVVEVGGPHTLEQSIEALAYGGHLALIGGAAGYQGTSNPMGLTLKNADVSCLFVGSREHFEAMNRALDAWSLRPAIDRTFAFEEAPEAYAHLKSGSHIGKVVIVLD